MNDDPSKVLVAQRVRNHIIEHLELIASFDDKARFQQIALIHVPHEIINGWEDWVRDDILDWFSERRANP